MATPRSRGGRSVTSTAPMDTVPASASSSPATIRSRVDLPQPELDGAILSAAGEALTVQHLHRKQRRHCDAQWFRPEVEEGAQRLCPRFAIEAQGGFGYVDEADAAALQRRLQAVPDDEAARARQYRVGIALLH